MRLWIKSTVLLPFHSSSYWKQKKKKKKRFFPFQDKIKTLKTGNFTSPTDTKLFDDKFLQKMDIFLRLRNNNTTIQLWLEITTLPHAHAHTHTHIHILSAMLWHNHDSIFWHGVQASCHNTMPLKLQTLVEGTTKSPGKYGDHGMSAICFSATDFYRAIDLWVGALSWRRIYWLHHFSGHFLLTLTHKCDSCYISRKPLFALK